MLLLNIRLVEAIYIFGQKKLRFARFLILTDRILFDNMFQDQAFVAYFYHIFYIHLWMIIAILKNVYV